MPSPPRPVRLLQDCGIILSGQAHQRHHYPPHVTDYCIATGWCNGPLNRLGAFRRLERAVTWMTGMMPREDERSFQPATAQTQGASQHGNAEYE